MRLRYAATVKSTVSHAAAFGEYQVLSQSRVARRRRDVPMSEELTQCFEGTALCMPGGVGVSTLVRAEALHSALPFDGSIELRDFHRFEGNELPHVLPDLRSECLWQRHAA